MEYNKKPVQKAVFKGGYPDASQAVSFPSNAHLNHKGSEKHKRREGVLIKPKVDTYDVWMKYTVGSKAPKESLIMTILGKILLITIFSYLYYLLANLLDCLYEAFCKAFIRRTFAKANKEDKEEYKFNYPNFEWNPHSEPEPPKRCEFFTEAAYDDPDILRREYLKLSKRHHPDKGGDEIQFKNMKSEKERIESFHKIGQGPKEILDQGELAKLSNKNVPITLLDKLYLTAQDFMKAPGFLPRSVRSSMDKLDLERSQWAYSDIIEYQFENVFTYSPPITGGFCALYCIFLHLCRQNVLYATVIQRELLATIRLYDRAFDKRSPAEIKAALQRKGVFSLVLAQTIGMPYKMVNDMMEKGDGFSFDEILPYFNDLGIPIAKTQADVNCVDLIRGRGNIMHAVYRSDQRIHIRIVDKEVLTLLGEVIPDAIHPDNLAMTKSLLYTNQVSTSKLSPSDLPRLLFMKGETYAIFNDKRQPLYVWQAHNKVQHAYVCAQNKLWQIVENPEPEKAETEPTAPLPRSSKLSYELPPEWKHLPFQEGENDFDSRTFTKELLNLLYDHFLQLQPDAVINPTQQQYDDLKTAGLGFFIGIETPGLSKRYDLYGRLGYVYKWKTGLQSLQLNGAGSQWFISPVNYQFQSRSLTRISTIPLGPEIRICLYSIGQAEDQWVLPNFQVETRNIHTLSDFVSSCFYVPPTYTVIYSPTVQEKIHVWLHLSNNWEVLYQKPSHISLCAQYVRTTSKEPIQFDDNFVAFVVDAQNKIYNSVSINRDNTEFSISTVTDKIFQKINNRYGDNIRSFLRDNLVVGSARKLTFRMMRLYYIEMIVALIYMAFFLFGAYYAMYIPSYLWTFAMSKESMSIVQFYYIIFQISTILCIIESLREMIRWGPIKYCLFWFGIVTIGLCIAHYLYKKSLIVRLSKVFKMGATREDVWGLTIGEEYPGVPIVEDKLAKLHSYVFEESCSLRQRKFFDLSGARIAYKKFLTMLENAPIRLPLLTNTQAIAPGFRFLGAKIPLPEPVNGLWAFIIRHITPKVLPDKRCNPNFKRAFKKHKILQQFREAWSTYQKRSFEEYMDGVEKAKQKSYWKGWRDFFRNPIIPMVLQIVVKPDEKQYKGLDQLLRKLDFVDFKARNIFNPSDQVKAVLGYVVGEIMRCLKTTPIFKKHFVQGWTTEHLEQEVLNAWNSMKDPVAFSYDGGNHDAHQHESFIKNVDNYFLSRVLSYVSPDLGFNEDQSAEISLKVLLVNCPVQLFAPKELTGLTLLGSNRIRILSGILNATVFSGHPSRTTFGNTMRVLMLLIVVSDDISIRFGVDVHPFQSGDDTYIIIEREFIAIFRKGLLVYYSEVEGGTHGYGQLMKEYQLLGNRVDFLSKVGIISNHRALIFRNPRRLIATGTLSASIYKTLTMPQYNYAVTKCLEASYAGFPGMDSMIAWRKANLEHAFTEKLDVKYEMVKEVHHGSVNWEDLGPYQREFELLEQLHGNPTSSLLVIRGHI